MSKKKENALKIGSFVPVMKPSYADYDELMQAHKGKTFAELKHDGYRVQIHKNSERFWLFTGNGNEYNYRCYPDIVQIVERLPSCMLEAEMIAKGNTHNQVFDNVKKRFRRDGISDASIDKYVNSGVIAEVPLSLKVFDTLKFDNRGIANQPLEMRRKYTENIDIEGIAPSELTIIDNKPALESLVEKTLSMNQEGLVCKDPSSLYLPGHVGNEWVKFKRSEPLDLVVVGVYQTEGVISGALCATYNHETGMYETLGKISTVRIADEFIPLVLDKLVDEKPGNVLISDKLKKPAYERFVPYRFVKPEQSVVLEIRAMNIYHSDNWQTCGENDGKGFSMRIGFVREVRYDKDSIHATRTSAVRKLYELQKKLEGGEA